MTDIAISAIGVSKCYRVFDNERKRLSHALWPKQSNGFEKLWALRDINFEIKRGEAVAIIGRNGSGKSTLLEILTGTLTPTSGTVEVNGRVSGLLELGSGFNPEYSGRDNVILNGLLLGLQRDDIIRRFEEIEAFAEIGSAIERPVKTYSSGMIMRLAFAVQVLCDPEILVVDEALSVGDFFFQQKCLRHVKKLCDQGVTLLFVSHDMGTVRDLCPRVIYLQKGSLIFDGAGGEGIPLFFRETGSQQPFEPAKKIEAAIDYKTVEPGVKIARCQKIKDDAIWSVNPVGQSGKLLAVALYDKHDRPSVAFKMSEQMNVKVAFSPDNHFANHISVSIYDKFGVTRSVTGSLPLHLTPVTSSEECVFDIKIDLMIEAGEYALNINLGYELEKNRGQVLDETGMIGPITIQWDYENETAPFLGQVGLPAVAKFYSNS